jgi:hypothetical protein
MNSASAATPPAIEPVRVTWLDTYNRRRPHAALGGLAPLTIDVSAVAIEISDDGQAVTSLPGSGHGIMGMRERALLLGGSLTAGPRAAGGFRVAARLPIGGGAT